MLQGLLPSFSSRPSFLWSAAKGYLARYSGPKLRGKCVMLKSLLCTLYWAANGLCAPVFA